MDYRLIIHRHRKPKKSEEWKWGWYTDDRTLALLDSGIQRKVTPSKNNFSKEQGVHIKLSPPNKFEETNISEALMDVSEIFTRMEKTFEKESRTMHGQRIWREETLPELHLEFVKKHGLFRESQSISKKITLMSQSDHEFVGYIMDLGNLLDFATNRHALKIQKYFEKREQGASFFLYPQETDRGIIKQYEARHLVDALEHEIVEICELKTRHKRCEHCREVFEPLRASGRFCKDACRKANERNKKKLAEYQKNLKNQEK